MQTLEPSLDEIQCRFSETPFRGFGCGERIERDVRGFQAREAFIKIDTAALAAHRLQRCESPFARNADVRSHTSRRARTLAIDALQRRRHGKTRERNTSGDETFGLSSTRPRVNRYPVVSKGAICFDAHVNRSVKGGIDWIDRKLSEFSFD